MVSLTVESHRGAPGAGDLTRRYLCADLISLGSVIKDDPIAWRVTGVDAWLS
ncbi:hypothetical protein M406DRAFT_323338 [Cryphonectria parasitica EP155]|uniref:Uncharacterized protein n=1 Tax=Cryphonectria parasitica (strain ATCC 38755 / EP155) TaxID=660469 RepID=A0A9P5CNE8_CRYP1|nr:uncharacterized protein M406DRAFT_323338 [Cryphonectria parasitica EP155]KAF3763835.1 hypothetical protein M406DRAFT_323338 [Cryphonectria parasitica EP155]